LNTKIGSGSEKRQEQSAERKGNKAECEARLKNNERARQKMITNKEVETEAIPSDLLGFFRLLFIFSLPVFYNE